MVQTTSQGSADTPRDSAALLPHWNIKQPHRNLLLTPSITLQPHLRLRNPTNEHPDTIRPPATADTPPIEGRSEEIIIAGQFIDMENQLLGQYKLAMLQALCKDPLYIRALDSSKVGKHYYISDGFLKVNTTTSEDIIYIPQGRLEGGVSLREFILQHVHDSLRPFSLANCYLSTITYF